MHRGCQPPLLPCRAREFRETATYEIGVFWPKFKLDVRRRRRARRVCGVAGRAGECFRDGFRGLFSCAGAVLTRWICQIRVECCSPDSLQCGIQATLFIPACNPNSLQTSPAVSAPTMSDLLRGWARFRLCATKNLPRGLQTWRIVFFDPRRVRQWLYAVHWTSGSGANGGDARAYTGCARSTPVRLAGVPRRTLARGGFFFMLETLWRRSSCVRAVQVRNCRARELGARFRHPPCTRATPGF